MSARASIEELKAHAVDRLDDIIAQLCPGGRNAGGFYTVRNPTRDDRRPGSFVIYTRGHRRGVFIEFANRDQEKGDVIDLVSYLLHNGAGFKDKEARKRALDWIASLVGLDRLDGRSRAAAIESARRRRSRDEAEASDREARRARAADKFLHASRILSGTAVERYLAGRGIALADLPEREDDIRSLASAEYWMGAPRAEDGRKLGRGPHYPAMVAAIRDGLGLIQGVHLTFLTEDGAKAPVEKPKLIAGFTQGCVIRLAKGISGLTPEEAAELGISGPCALSEGIEDGLTIAAASPELRVWAAISLGNIGHAPALPCVDAWLPHRQNDWSARQAVAAFDRARQELEATGRPVAEIRVPGAFKDINDLARG
jgi:hypothetical protein